jgi:hypothetical protein
MSSVNQNIDFHDNIDVMARTRKRAGPAAAGDCPLSCGAKQLIAGDTGRIDPSDPGAAAPLEPCSGDTRSKINRNKVFISIFGGRRFRMIARSRWSRFGDESAKGPGRTQT